jgi:hypothetical protein
LTGALHDFAWQERLFDGLEALVGIMNRPVPVDDDEAAPTIGTMKLADGHEVKPWDVILGSWQSQNPGKDLTNNRRKLDRLIRWLKAKGYPHNDAAAVTKPNTATRWSPTARRPTIRRAWKIRRSTTI